jgi:hypothetical protein
MLIQSNMKHAKGIVGVDLRHWTSSIYRATLSRMRADSGDPMRLGASDNEGVRLWIGYGAIYVQGGQQS